MELFHLDILFQVFEVGVHCLKPLRPLSVPLSYLEPPFPPYLPTPGSQQMVIFFGGLVTDVL